MVGAKRKDRNRNRKTTANSQVKLVRFRGSDEEKGGREKAEDYVDALASYRLRRQAAGTTACRRPHVLSFLLHGFFDLFCQPNHFVRIQQVVRITPTAVDGLVL